MQLIEFASAHLLGELEPSSSRSPSQLPLGSRTCGTARAIMFFEARTSLSHILSHVTQYTFWSASSTTWEPQSGQFDYPESVRPSMLDDFLRYPVSQLRCPVLFSPSVVVEWAPLNSAVFVNVYCDSCEVFLVPLLDFDNLGRFGVDFGLS